MSKFKMGDRVTFPNYEGRSGIVTGYRDKFVEVRDDEYKVGHMWGEFSGHSGGWLPTSLRIEAEQTFVAPTFADKVDIILADLGTLLKQKNIAYGDSALNPVRIFSKADPADGLRVRIDDKLSRIARGSDAGEDTVTDLLGYLVMLKISEGNK